MSARVSGTFRRWWSRASTEARVIAGSGVNRPSEVCRHASGATPTVSVITGIGGDGGVTEP